MIYIKTRSSKKKYSKFITSSFFYYILPSFILLSLFTSIVSVQWRFFILRAAAPLLKLTGLVVVTPWKLVNTKHLGFIPHPHPHPGSQRLVAFTSTLPVIATPKQVLPLSLAPPAPPAYYITTWAPHTCMACQLFKNTDLLPVWLVNSCCSKPPVKKTSFLQPHGPSLNATNG